MSWLEDILDGFSAIAVSTLFALFLWACYQTFGFNPLVAFGLKEPDTEETTNETTAPLQSPQNTGTLVTGDGPEPDDGVRELGGSLGGLD